MKNILLLLLVFIYPLTSFAQLDSLLMKNGDRIVGSIKNMDKGVIEIKTEYSDTNFKVKWKGIGEIQCNTNFMITLSNGKRINGKINSKSSELYQIITRKNKIIDIKPDDIVFLKSVNQSFISKISANVDVGYRYTKANSLSQFNSSAFIGYRTNRWNFTLSNNNLISTQNNADNIERNEGSITANYFLPRDYFATASLSYFSNTEQSIQLRTISSLGIGKYLIHSNVAYWGFSTGGSFLTESFDSVVNNEGEVYTKPFNTEAEWYIGMDLNLFDTGRLTFNTQAKGYRTVLKSTRWRIDLVSNIKYKLPYDFYIKAAYNLNYDTQPAEVGKEIDYQYTFGFGWKLK